MKGPAMNTENRYNAHAWIKGFGQQMLNMPARVDATQFVDAYGAKVVVGVGGAAQGATSVPVAALTREIPVGTVLDFGGAKFARLTAVGLVGATTLTVTALVTALVAADQAIYSPKGTKLIPSGTPVGRTFAERAANALWGPAVSTDDEIYFVYNDIVDALDNPDCELTNPDNIQIAENYLPDYTTVLAPSGVASALLVAIRARFKTMIATD